MSIKNNNDMINNDITKQWLENALGEHWKNNEDLRTGHNEAVSKAIRAISELASMHCLDNDGELARFYNDISNAIARTAYFV